MEKIPVKIAILNNGYLGMVRQWQELFYDKRYAHTCLNAPSCGRKGTKNCSECDKAAGQYCPDSCVNLQKVTGQKVFGSRKKKMLLRLLKSL